MLLYVICSVQISYSYETHCLISGKVYKISNKHNSLDDPLRNSNHNSDCTAKLDTNYRLSIEITMYEQSREESEIAVATISVLLHECVLIQNSIWRP